MITAKIFFYIYIRISKQTSVLFCGQKDIFIIVQTPDIFFLQNFHSSTQKLHFNLVQTYCTFPQQKDFMIWLSGIFLLHEIFHRSFLVITGFILLQKDLKKHQVYSVVRRMNI